MKALTFVIILTILCLGASYPPDLAHSPGVIVAASNQKKGTAVAPAFTIPDSIGLMPNERKYET